MQDALIDGLVGYCEDAVLIAGHESYKSFCDIVCGHVV